MSKICPYCGGELLTGYIQSRDGVCWSEKKKLVSALPGLANAAEKTLKHSREAHRKRGHGVKLPEMPRYTYKLRGLSL